MADDNQKPIVQKLGIDQGMTVSILNAPNYFHFDLGDLPDDVEVRRDADNKPADLFLIFSSRSAEAERGFHRAMTLLPADGAIWVAWPKKSSGHQTDINEDTLKDVFGPKGMVDDEACSIDETWSAVRFVVREENRDDWPSELEATE